MPGANEVMRSVYGAWRLARLDPGGMNAFDLTVDGFWRSFFAMVLVAPAYVLLAAQKYAALAEPVGVFRVLVVESLGYVVGWAAFPIAAILLTRLLGLARLYVPLVVATNWAAVIQIAVFMAAVVLARLLGEGAGALLMLAVTILLVAYQWFVIRTALDTTGANAFGLLAVDLLLSAIVNVLTDAWATAG
jgi:hypothetical protein